MGSIKREIILIMLVLGCLLLVGLPAYGEENPFSLSTVYSYRDQGELQAGYKIGNNFDIKLGYLSFGHSELPGSRWQGKLIFTPLTGLNINAGYDFTGDNYFLGANAWLPLKDNLNLVSGLNTIIAGSGEKYLDYLCGLQIGVGYDHYLLAGAKGFYQIDTAHEPELFLELDLNWRLPKGFGIHVAPHVGVEGNFSHKTTISKRWGKRLQAGIFAGQKEDHLWNYGLSIKY